MKNGFTLIELLVIIAILGILGTLVITQLNCAKENCNNKEPKAVNEFN